MKNIKSIIITVIYILQAGILWAELDTKVGTTGASFLKIGVGARALALGESFVAVADDVNSLYWNPAGISQIKTNELMLMHNVWFIDTSYEYIGFVYPMQDRAIGISAGYLNLGTIEGKDSNDNVISSFKAYDMYVGLSYSERIEVGLEEEGRLLVGGTVKVIQEKIEETTATGFGVDIGGLFWLSEELSVGMIVQNIGTSMKYIEEKNSLPMNIKVGGAYRLLEDKELLVSVDVSKPLDNKMIAGTGAEYKLYDKSWGEMMIIFRGGYKYQIGGNDDIGLTGVSGGLGFVYSLIEVDYAFVPYGRLGNSHRVALVVKF
ncbi:MAG: PorV/PorQ family protein [Candidatus Firestonebacteria bacterium]